MEKNVVITISRQFGSNGREIARKLAEYLDISYYNKEILERIAMNMGVCADFFKDQKQDANGLFTIDDLEEAMQKVMDEYAGGIASNYQFNEKQLKLAEEKIARLNELAEQIGAEDMHELLFAYELKERLLVCQVLIEHLKNRKETRWHSFNENLDHPETDEKFEKYVNSRMEDGKLHILFRDLVKGDTYEHTNS